MNTSDIERLMIRLHELMPHDQRHGSADQFAFLVATARRRRDMAAVLP